MLRNYFNFNDFSISQRGGDVLLTRAAKNQMTWDEYSGSFYVYSPKWIRKNVFEKFLGFNNGDLLPGGRFVRLIRYQPGDAEAIKAGNVEKTISYYARVRAVISKKDIEYSKQGLPIYLVDEDIKKLAIDMIKNDPIKHLLMTIPFLWRGNIIIFLSLISMLTISIIKKKPDWFAFSLFGVGLFMFYALLSHFIVRYSTPLIPLAIVSILVMMNSLIMKLLKITLPAKPLTR